ATFLREVRVGHDARGHLLAFQFRGEGPRRRRYPFVLVQPDRTGDEHVVTPDNWRAPALAGDVDLPRDVLGAAPALGQLRVVWNDAAAQPSELRPIRRRCAVQHGDADDNSRQPEHELRGRDTPEATYELRVGRSIIWSACVDHMPP